MSALSRTHRPSLNPRLRQLTQLRLRARGRLAAFAGRPAPGDEIVVRQVLVQLRERAPAVAVLILDLLANLADRLPLPCHLERSEAPARMAGDALVGRTGTDEGEVLLGVAGGARESRDAHAAFATPGGRHVFVMIRALQRMFARRMAVHAARMREHFRDLAEQGARPFTLISDG